MQESERDRLETIAAGSLYAATVMPAAIRYCFKIMQRFVRGNDVLEMGPAEGVMTEQLDSAGYRLTLVEGSARFCRELGERFPNAKVHHALFEEFEPSSEFDCIVLGHVLEHVEDPVAVVRRASTWLRPEGRIFAAVPNARSLHRQAAVDMGLLSREHELNQLDIHHGHRRVFDPESFRSVFPHAGLRIEVFGGYWLTLISNQQIQTTWSQEMLDAFMRLGERYPDIAAEIYVVATK